MTAFVGISPAAQPAIHNPDPPGRGGASRALRDVAFAGTYFAHKYPERREQMETVLGGADAAARPPHGLTFSGTSAATTAFSSLP